MSLSKEEQKVLEKVKEKVKLMNQVLKFEKQVFVTEKKLETMKLKLSELIKKLDDENNPDEKSSVKSTIDKRKAEDPSALFSEH